MALLEATSALRTHLGALEVATVDHGLRPEAAGEVAFVAAAARVRGLRCHEIRLRLAGGSAIEARARDARYSALERVRQARRFDLIATAHTASDQAETVLMRLSRGSALAGAAGILGRREHVVRPMLGCTRDDVRRFLASRQVEFIDDPMNRDDRFLRVRVREQVLPVLEHVAGPGVAQRVARFAAWASDDEALLSGWADAARRRLSLPGGALDATGLAALPPPLLRRVLVDVLSGSELAVDAALIERMVRAVVTGGAATLPSGAVLRCASGVVRVEGAASPVDGAAPAGEGALLQVDAPPQALGYGAWVALRSVPPDGAAGVIAQPLQLPLEPGPLVVRYRRAGDRVRLRSGQHRKLQDLLVDARIPRERRDSVPLVVTSDGTIVCVVGVWPRPRRARAAETTSWLVSGAPERGAGGRPAGAL